jgi:vacuolar-type H+-ATPase subunit I/STV1
MSIGLIIELVGILLLLILGYNVMLQYKVKASAAKKQEAARHISVIDATEDLISNAHHVPFSRDLLICLNNRILDSLQSMHELDPRNKQLAQRVSGMTAQVNSLKSQSNDSETTPFKVPSNDKQAIVMLKLVKRLRDTIRHEHNKGRIDTQAYVTENARLETIQMRINIENVIKRANDSMVRGQPGTAIQLLKKGIDVLSSKNDAYSNQAREKLQQMYDELEQKRQTKQLVDTSQETSEHASDMEALFGEKKKW